MANQHIQFQPGMSIPELLRNFGTEPHCAEAVKHGRWPDGFLFPRRELSKYYVGGHGAQTFPVQWVPAPDLAAGRQPYGAHQTAADDSVPGDLPHQAGQDRAVYACSQMPVGRELPHCVVAGSESQPRHGPRDSTHFLGGAVQLDDAYLGSERAGGKTGRGAKNKVPFVAAVSLDVKGASGVYQAKPRQWHHVQGAWQVRAQVGRQRALAVVPCMAHTFLARAAVVHREGGHVLRQPVARQRAGLCGQALQQRRARRPQPKAQRLVEELVAPVVLAGVEAVFALHQQAEVTAKHVAVAHPASHGQRAIQPSLLRRQCLQVMPQQSPPTHGRQVVIQLLDFDSAHHRIVHKPAASHHRRSPCGCADYRDVLTDSGFISIPRLKPPASSRSALAALFYF